MKDILGKLSGGTSREEVIFNRIKSILNSSPLAEESKIEDAKIPKEDAKFIQLHFENKWGKYHMHFGDYNTEMLQQLAVSMTHRSFGKNEAIYNQGDIIDSLYFILSGTVHIIENDEQGNEKIANIFHENQLFGFNKGINGEKITQRARSAVTETDTQLILIDLERYESIRKQRVLSSSEAKIEYLTRFIPGFRSVSPKIVQELETIFQKEKVTKGFRIIEQGKINDFLFFILAGDCRLLYNYTSNKKIASKLDMTDSKVPKYINVGKLGVGDWFGQTSAVTQTPCKYSVQAASEEVVLYRISWSSFYENFGKDVGKPVKNMRAKAVMDKNWIQNVIKRLSCK